jgi:hypothetical protein
MDEDQREEAAFLIKQNRRIKAKIREQAQVFQTERSKLLAVHHSLKQSLHDEQERNRIAIEEFNQRITEFEVELRRSQADPRISLLPLELESCTRRQIAKRTPKFSDLEAEGERLMEETNRILAFCRCEPITLPSEPPPTFPERPFSSGSSVRPLTPCHSSNGRPAGPSRPPAAKEEEEEETAPTTPPPAPSPRRSSSSGRGIADEPGVISGQSSGPARRPSDTRKQSSGIGAQPRQPSGGDLELPDRLSGFGSAPDGMFSSPPGSRQPTQPAGQPLPQGTPKPFDSNSGGWSEQGDSEMRGSFGEPDVPLPAASHAAVVSGQTGGARRSSEVTDLRFGSDLEDWLQ